MDEQTTNRLKSITEYHANTGIPTRRYSEEYLTSPSPESGSSATRDMTRDIGVFTSNLLSYGFDEIKRIEVSGITELYISMLESTGIVKTAEEVRDLFKIDHTALSQQNISDILSDYPSGTIPHTLAEYTVFVANSLEIDMPKAMQFCMRFVNKQFSKLALQSTLFQEQGYSEVLASRLAFQFVMSRIKTIVTDAVRLQEQGIPIGKALSSLFSEDYIDATTERAVEGSIVLTIEEFRGFKEAYKVQRRPYSSQELLFGQRMLDENPNLIKSFLILQILLARYSESRLLDQPERLEYSSDHLDTIYLSRSSEGRLAVSPNPKFIGTAVNNWMGAIARVALSENLSLDPKSLSPTSISQGITLASGDLSVFNMNIGLFESNTVNPETVRLKAVVGRVCPAKSMITQVGSILLPEIYLKLTT